MKKKQILTIAAFSLFLTVGVSGTALAAGTWKNGTSGERCYIDENGVQMENPVSYTHLTLPTIA